MINVLLFYKFLAIEDPEKLGEEQLELCKSIGLKGRILIAKEGINGSVSGTNEQTEKFKQIMHNDDRFSDIMFKEQEYSSHPFSKVNIKIKKEVVRFQQPIDLNKRGKYISPKEFLELYKNNEDVIILDIRNDYEWKIGKFENATTLNIETFHDFPVEVEKLKDKKDKKIVMYCTGGIRCEKASAFMIQKGFKNIYQLEGGVLNFCKEFPDTVWQGKLFVFDKRLVSSVNRKDSTIAQCCSCKISCDIYRNCNNPDCNDLVVLCQDCNIKMNGHCSIECTENYLR